MTRHLRWADNRAVTERLGSGGGHNDARLADDIRRRLFWQGWIANGIGILLIFNLVGFLIPIFVDPSDRTALGLQNAPIVLAYAVISGFITTRLTRRKVESSLAWITEGREPSQDEHRETLRLAAYQVKVVGAAWAIGGALFAIFNGVAYSWGFAAVVGAVVWLGGETTLSLIYLIAERVVRPATARALAAKVPSGTVAPGVRSRLAMAWSLGTGVPLIGILVVAIVGLTKSGVDSEYVAAAILFLGVIAMIAGLVATLYAAKAIADPVTSVRSGLEQVERGRLGARVEVDDASEVGLLQAGFNQMAEGLREREQIRDLFGRQVGRDVARAALRDGTQLGGEEREIGVMFVDLVGSTSMAMSMLPAEVVRLLNVFFRVVVETVESEEGLVNKFEGDGAMCVFGAPVAADDPAGQALRAARRLAERLSVEVPELDFGIGVSAGRAVAGNVGAEQRFEYTVIGDPVNEAARLSDLAKLRDERLLASEAALRRARDDEGVAWSLRDSAELRGRGVPTRLAMPLSLGDA